MHNLKRRLACLTKGGGFNPASISNLVLWADAGNQNSLYVDAALSTVITGSGATVGGWLDKSPRAHSLQNGVIAGGIAWFNAPDTGYPMGSVLYDGSELLQIATTGDFELTQGQAHTQFFAHVINDVSGTEYLASNTDAPWTTNNLNGFGWDIWYDGAGTKETKYSIRDRNNHVISASIADNISNTPNIVSVTHDWANLKIYSDGVLKATTSSATLDTSAAGDGVYFMGANGAGGGGFNGLIFVHLFYKKVLSQAEHNRVGRWLANRLGITWTDL